jgi:pimeloyl-ACP methyl ester carboxylesterase
MLRHLLFLSCVAACSGEAQPSSVSSQNGKFDGVDVLPVQMAPPPESWFAQSIDHATAAGTFPQRYWVSTQFAGGPDSPVLFHLCGEGPCDPGYATLLADSAKSLGAAVVVLEHRYYGESLPYKDLTLDHMRYLTIENALEDAATFERWAQINLGLRGKWIVIGGSYPGMLAAFYREKHPELAVGAWASSAPIDVSLSFWGYDAIVADALGEECAGQVRVVLGYAEDAWNDPAQRDVWSQQLFGATGYELADFLNGVSGFALSAAQYGLQGAFCAQLAQSPDQPLNALTAWHMAYADLPLKSLRPGKMPPLHAPAADDFDGNQWLYQVCTQVGFYQTHNLDQGHSVMSWLIDEKYWSSICDAYVGGQPAIAETRARYFDAINDGRVSNLLFVNGTLDPWSALSYAWQEQAPDGVTVATVVGGSHCSDLDNLMPDSRPDVVAAHQRFHDLALEWLK